MNKIKRALPFLFTVCVKIKTLQRPLSSLNIVSYIDIINLSYYVQYLPVASD